MHKLWTTKSAMKHMGKYFSEGFSAKANDNTTQYKTRTMSLQKNKFCNYLQRHNKKGRHNRCLVPGYVGGSKNKFGICRHFCHKHPETIKIISEDI